MLFSNRGQGNFRGLEASMPRPRTSSRTPLLFKTQDFKGGELSSQLWRFIIAKVELKFFPFFVLILRLQRYSTIAKRYPLQKVFGNSEYCSSCQNHTRSNGLENCGFSGKNNTQSFQKLFSVDIFFYLLNIFATAAPKLKQKTSKIVFQFHLL